MACLIGDTRGRREAGRCLVACIMRDEQLPMRPISAQSLVSDSSPSGRTDVSVGHDFWRGRAVTIQFHEICLSGEGSLVAAHMGPRHTATPTCCVSVGAA